MKENFYPLIFNLATKNILFIGGGNVAERKIILLLNAANIYVIAPSTTNRLTMLYNSGKIDITFRKFEDQDIKHCYSFVFACTNNIELNRHIGKLCKDNNIFVFVAGDKICQISICQQYIKVKNIYLHYLPMASHLNIQKS